MPRTTTIECPGCPPLRALTFDNLGLIKVIEARSKEGGNPKVVERWGEPDASKCVLAASIDDRKSNPLLAVARKNGLIEVLSPVNGNLNISMSLHSDDDGKSTEYDNVIGLHLFKNKGEDSSSSLLTCTTKGNASLRCVEVPDSAADIVLANPLQSWSVCGSGEVTFCKLDGGENYSLFGGKGVEVNMWDLEKNANIWTAKAPPKNSLGIFTPTWFTSSTFLNKDDHRKFVAGTNSHQLRLYDISAQRRPVLSVDFREAPITAVVEDPDGHTVYFGNGMGDLASIDIRTGKMSGCFIGKCSGSIRSIARHPELPVLASCGLDSYLRFWDVNSRQLLSAVFLKQHLTNVVLDSNFTDEVVAATTTNQLPDNVEDVNEAQDESDEKESSVKRKASSRQNSGKKLKSKKKTTDASPINSEDLSERWTKSEDDYPAVKRKKASKESRGNKKLKSKKKTTTDASPINSEDLSESQTKSEDDYPAVKRKKASKESRGNKKLKSKKLKKARDEIASVAVS